MLLLLLLTRVAWVCAQITGTNKGAYNEVEDDDDVDVDGNVGEQPLAPKFLLGSGWPTNCLIGP